MVNRLWRWHFSEGLVRSVDNFGKLGEPPVNSTLLNWLGQEFVRSGWSLKAMHRIMLNSATYQMGSAPDRRQEEIDPDNRFQWRTNIRRLEAEAIRDSLLAVSGLLDNSMGGSLLHVKNREFFFDHTSKDETNYDSFRRSVYLPVVRNHLYDVFALFDYADASVPNGDRPASTVASQSLFMMNSELMIRSSEALAAMALKCEPANVDGRMNWLYNRIYGRPATEVDLAAAHRLLAELAAPAEVVSLGACGNGSAGAPEDSIAASTSAAAANSLEAWTALCHVLLAANEFVHVR
jgi:hypothetical protein